MHGTVCRYGIGKDANRVGIEHNDVCSLGITARILAANAAKAVVSINRLKIYI